MRRQKMTSKRYTIRLSVCEVDEEGDDFPEELAGCTLDYTLSDLETIENIMRNECDALSEGLFWSGGKDRRPPEEEEEAG
jgi:hypothetical protein